MAFGRRLEAGRGRQTESDEQNEQGDPRGAGWSDGGAKDGHLMGGSGVRDV